jgi:hypothetical protein
MYLPSLARSASRRVALASSERQVSGAMLGTVRDLLRSSLRSLHLCSSAAAAGRLKRNAFLAAAVVSLAVCGQGCGPAPRGSITPTFSDKEIVATLNRRVGAQACCFYTGEKDGKAEYGPLKASRELHFVVRHLTGAGEIVCGYSGFPAARAFNGQSMSSGPDTIFVVRGRRLYLEQDMADEQFERMQDELCGPDWVKPFRIRPVP